MRSPAATWLFEMRVEKRGDEYMYALMKSGLPLLVVTLAAQLTSPASLGK